MVDRHNNQIKDDLIIVMFVSNFSLCGSIWRSTQIQIEFLRALHQTDWTTAEHCIKHSLAFSKHRSEPLFLKLQLFLAQGTIHILRKHFLGGWGGTMGSKNVNFCIFSIIVMITRNQALGGWF